MVSENSIGFVQFPNVVLPVRSPSVKNVPEFANASPAEFVGVYEWGRVSRNGTSVRVLPSKSGTHRFTLFAESVFGERICIPCSIIVNPDPKTLWKVVEPPSDSRFPKKHTDIFSYLDKSVRIVAASRRGRSHENSGSFRDDDMLVATDSVNHVYIIAVADGAGSAKYAREGSRIAVETVIGKLKEKMTMECRIWSDAWKSNLRGILGAVAFSAYRKIAEKVETMNSNDEGPVAIDDFGTTLLLAAVRFEKDGQLRMATFSIGDGAIAWVHGRTAELLCEPDDGDFAGQTRFLTMRSVWPKTQDEWKSFQESRIFTYSCRKNEAQCGHLFVMTDGVSDPFFG